MSQFNGSFVRNYTDYLGARRCCGVGGGGVGPVGPVGVDGPRGPAGAIGYTGQTGPTGPRGCRGYPGTAMPLLQSSGTSKNATSATDVINFGGDGILLQAGNYAINWTIIFNTGISVGPIQVALCVFPFGSSSPLSTYLNFNQYYVNNVASGSSYPITTFSATDQLYINDPIQIQIGCYQKNGDTPGDYEAHINAVFIPVL